MTGLFSPSEIPRLFGVPPGVDYPKALVDGLRRRASHLGPEALGQVEVYVNTRRMARRIQSLFQEGPPSLLPKIRLITDLAQDPGAAHIPPAAPRLRRRLELVQLISKLLEAEPDLAPKFSMFDLADSLVALMEEMHGEGVSPEVLARLDVSDQSGHWDRALRFISLVQRYFGHNDHAPDQEARQRMVVESMIAAWQEKPPAHTVLVAGSTGSRGSTALLMKAVSKLPQGAVILPGFDTSMPLSNWSDLDNALTAEDHPQYRFKRLLEDLGLEASEVRLDWGPEKPFSQARNDLVSLALRPAPVTDQWLRDGPKLSDLSAACENMALVEADSQRQEALAIALILRKAVEDGRTAALVAPDRVLARRVAAALLRWGILPDDSAGIQLPLTPPGRFLRHILGFFGQVLTSEELLVLLKHPLTNAGNRGQHQLWTQSLELFIRQAGGPFPDRDMMYEWAGAQGDAQADAKTWADWVFDALEDLADIQEAPLESMLAKHLDVAEILANGPYPPEIDPLWENDAGREAAKLMQEFQQEAPLGGDVGTADYRSLFEGVLSLGQVRNPETPHPKVLTWGTLEARVQGADLVVLSGLNEGTWPESPRPDPWMNRAMRQKAGLLLPERKIGLSAHDFQQAIASREVVLTRSKKSDDAETVASRWLSRLTNLLKGLPKQGGEKAFDAMLARGNLWLEWAAALESPTDIPKAFRPSPCPPVAARPKRISVTSVKTLIRDPYAIYAQRILDLRALDPLRQSPDAPLRGTLVHKVLEEFHQSPVEDDAQVAKARLMTISDSIFAQNAPWPTARELWRARLERVADWFIEREQERAKTMGSVGVETRGQLDIPLPPMTLTAEADRIDRDRTTGELHIFDYKTGTPPNPKVQKSFDKQLLLEAAMAEKGAFAEVGRGRVASATYIGLGSPPKEVPAPIEDGEVDETWEGFLRLLSAYLEPEKGYTSRRAMQKSDDAGYYDHLARFGEWELSDAPKPEVLE